MRLHVGFTLTIDIKYILIAYHVSFFEIEILESKDDGMIKSSFTFSHIKIVVG